MRNIAAVQSASSNQPRGAPLERGYAKLQVEVIAHQSAVTAASASTPMKLLTPRSRGQSVWAYTSSYGGGLVAGDETELHLTIGEGARCFVSTQAATKVYRNPAQLPCGHRGQASIGPNALLVFTPDPIQPFAESVYTQRQEWQLADSAGLVLLDWFSSGRSACGERWEFGSFHSRNDVFVGSNLACRDALLLEPERARSRHSTSHYNCFAMLLMLGNSVRGISQALLETIGKRPVTRGGSIITSVSPLKDGAMLRIAAEHVELAAQELNRHFQPLCELLGDNPWERKW